MVHDPTRFETEKDFYSSAFKKFAFDEIFQKSPSPDPFTVRTSIPLPHCDPLVGMRSMTCRSFTAFTLGFRLGESTDIELSKFSNGSTGLFVSLLTPSGATLSLYTQSPGFEEFNQGKFQVDVPIGKMHAFHANLQLQEPNPKTTVGASIHVFEHIDIITQLVSGLQGKKSLNIGAKFQPCAHFHTGLGIEASLHPSRIENIHSSTYFQTRAGGSLAMIGKYGITSPHSLQLVGTSQIKLWKNSDSRNTHLTAPPPVVGLSYDLLANRACAFIDLSVGAWSPSTEKKSGINVNIKVGVNVLKNNWTEPRFGVHLTATES